MEFTQEERVWREQIIRQEHHWRKRWENAYNTIPIPAVRVEDLIAEGKMKPEQIDDLGDVLLGNIPVHRKEDEIVIYSVGGMPTEDVAWGSMVYRNALEKGIGTKLNLWNAPKMVV